MADDPFQPYIAIDGKIRRQDSPPRGARGAFAVFGPSVSTAISPSPFLILVRGRPRRLRRPSRPHHRRLLRALRHLRRPIAARGHRAHHCRRRAFRLVAGTLIHLVASAIGATIACAMSRYLLRSWVQERLGRRAGRINEGVGKEGRSISLPSG